MVVLIPDSSLSVLVIASPAMNDPVGMLRVTVVELGFVSTTAVAPLEDPVMLLPSTRYVDAPTEGFLNVFSYIGFKILRSRNSHDVRTP